MNSFNSGLIYNIWQKGWGCIVYKLIVAKYIWQLRSVIPLMCVAESFIIIIPKQNVRNTESKNYAKYATTKFGNLTWHLGLIFWFWKNFLNVLNFHFLKYIKTSNESIMINSCKIQMMWNRNTFRKVIMCIKHKHQQWHFSFVWYLTVCLLCIFKKGKR